MAQGQLGKGVLAGLAAGLAGSFVMARYMDVVSRASHGRAKAPQDEDTTTIVAARATRAATGEDATAEGKRTGGRLVHYAFGTLMGGVYGAAAEYLPVAELGFGTFFATSLWLFADEFSLPRLALAKAPQEETVTAQLGHLAAHLVYGVATEAVRRGVRAALPTT